MRSPKVAEVVEKEVEVSAEQSVDVEAAAEGAVGTREVVIVETQNEVAEPTTDAKDDVESAEVVSEVPTSNKSEEVSDEATYQTLEPQGTNQPTEPEQVDTPRVVTTGDDETKASASD